MNLRNSIAVLLPLAATALAAQGKPSAAIPAMPVTGNAPVRLETPAPAIAHRATVSWQDGALTIEAQNSSLNSILRDISLRTGMKIVGGVQDERVFGKYGPGTAATVIAQLMDGAKCNVMMQSDAANMPIQLTLTPVTGGVSPPNPMQAEREPEEQRQPVPVQPVVAPQTQQQQPQRDPNVPMNNAPASPANQQPGADTTTQESPNGVRTPEQIFKQLQQLRQRGKSTQQPTQ